MAERIADNDNSCADSGSCYADSGDVSDDKLRARSAIYDDEFGRIMD